MAQTLAMTMRACACAPMPGWRVEASAPVSRATLAQADIKLTVTEYMLLHLAVGRSGLRSVGYYSFTARSAAVLLCALVLLFIPRLYVSNVQGQTIAHVL